MMRGTNAAVAMVSAMGVVGCELGGPLREGHVEHRAYGGKLELRPGWDEDGARWVLIRPGLITGGPIAVDPGEIEESAYALEGRFVEIFGVISADGDGVRTLTAEVIRPQ